MTERRIRYADHRPYTVVESLDELTGPTGGVVELPRHLDWSEQGVYELDNVRQLSVMYERGFVHRPSEDVDLFTTSAAEREFPEAVETVAAAFRRTGSGSRSRFRVRRSPAWRWPTP